MWRKISFSILLHKIEFKCLSISKPIKAPTIKVRKIRLHLTTFNICHNHIHFESLNTLFNWLNEDFRNKQSKYVCRQCKVLNAFLWIVRKLYYIFLSSSFLQFDRIYSLWWARTDKAQINCYRWNMQPHTYIYIYICIVYTITQAHILYTFSFVIVFFFICSLTLFHASLFVADFHSALWLYYLCHRHCWSIILWLIIINAQSNVIWS